jgi:hypothetical protein
MDESNTDSNPSTIADEDENEIPEKFKLDRKKIQTATLVDENDEINQLGLSVFNQADLEQGFFFKYPTSFLYTTSSLQNRFDRSSR